MKLSTPVTFSTQIQPLCLYTKTPVGGIGLKGTVTGQYNLIFIWILKEANYKKSFYYFRMGKKLFLD